jgi:Pentapeptide repeats (8 copies)
MHLHSQGNIPHNGLESIFNEIYLLEEKSLHYQAECKLLHLVDSSSKPPQDIRRLYRLYKSEQEKDKSQRQNQLHRRWQGFCKWTNFSQKTGWDILQILIIPISLAILTGISTYKFNQQTQQLATERYYQDTYQSYLNDMTKLILDKKIYPSESVAEDKTISKDKLVSGEVKTITRAKTLATLRQLKDGKLKGQLLAFLVEAKLLENSVINLEGADLQGAILKNIDLSKINLQDVNLKDADLQGTNLMEANLQKANLKGANLQDAYLDEADLEEANLENTNLKEAEITGIKLNNANLKSANLECAVYREWDENAAEVLDSGRSPKYYSHIVTRDYLKLEDNQYDHKTRFGGVKGGSCKLHIP